MGPDSEQQARIAKLYNACWPVRHYERGARSNILKAQRAKAIHDLGMAVRESFNATEDFEPLLIALFDGLSPKDAPPF